MDSSTILGLLEPYIAGAAGDWDTVSGQLARYLDLLMKWNARTNLTAIRSAEEIVRRHFGESLFAAIELGHVGFGDSLLDFGSGAGFPGIPIQLIHPGLRVTLAESQHKKAAFLREVVRELRLPAEVWPGRVEAMEPERRFDTVALRAVDRMQDALRAAAVRADRRLLVLSTAAAEIPEEVLTRFPKQARRPVPQADRGELLILERP